MFNRVAILVLITGIAIFFYGAVVKLHVPLVEWEGRYISAAEQVVHGQRSLLPGENPPLYIWYLAFWFKLFGVDPAIGRIANIFALSLTTLIIFFTTKSISNKACGYFAAAAYLLNPAVIQGSALMDLADTSLLPLIFILLVWAIVKDSQGRSPRFSTLFIALTVAFCFWLKITSALALMVSICLGLFLTRLRQNAPRIIKGIISGSAVFLISWIVISLMIWNKKVTLEILAAPFMSFRGVAFEGSLMNRMLSFVLNSLRIIFWLSPFAIFACLSIWKLSWQRSDNKGYLLNFLGWVSFIYFFSYLIVGGASWGFPRYYAAILPLFAVLIGIFAEEVFAKFSRRAVFIFFTLVIGLLIIYLFLLSDPVFLLTLGFKKAVLSGFVGLFIKHFVSEGFLYIMLPFLALVLFRRDFRDENFIYKIMVILYIGIIVSHLSLDIKQARASFGTSYEYGTQGRSDVIAFVLRQIEKKDTVMATSGLLYELREKDVPPVGCDVWYSEERVLKFLQESKPKVVIIGLTTHTVRELQGIRNHAKINAILTSEYTQYSIGTYRVWVRK